MITTPWSIRSLFCLSMLCCALSAVAFADQLQLQDGRVIEAEEVWEMGDAFWYKQGKLISSIPKAEVKRVITTKSAAKSVQVRVTTPGEPPRPASPLINRIILKDGTSIVVDEVQEDDRYIRYRLGNMHTLIEREAIERIEREAEISQPPPPSLPAMTFTTGNPGLDQLIARSAEKHQLDPLLIYLVMREESGFNHRAVSRVGARGLMQLMPATARRLGVRNIHDPLENVEAGTRFLKDLIGLYEGDVNLALAAYNAGENAVARYGRRVPPYRETQSYVRRINAAYLRARPADK
jgi:Transglycosylase SLT domain